jgi:hypothetical protein
MQVELITHYSPTGWLQLGHLLRRWQLWLLVHSIYGYLLALMITKYGEFFLAAPSCYKTTRQNNSHAIPAAVNVIYCILLFSVIFFPPYLEIRKTNNAGSSGLSCSPFIDLIS